MKASWTFLKGILMGSVLGATYTSMLSNFAQFSYDPALFNAIANASIGNYFLDSALGESLMYQLGYEDDNEISLHAEFSLLLTVNDGYLDFFLNWYAHYIANVDADSRSTMYVIAEDQVSHTKLTAFFEKMRGTEAGDVIVERSDLDMVSDGVYESKDYKKMVSTRATHILRHLREGRSIFYSDVDIVWKENPFPYFPEPMNGTVIDMYIQVDTAKVEHYIPYYCTGLMAIRATPQTIALMEMWEKKLEESPQLNQPIFNKLIYTKTTEGESPVAHVPFPRDKFPSGMDFFEKFTDEQRSITAVVHNNYIIGRDKKKKRFVDHNLWMPMALDGEESTPKEKQVEPSKQQQTKESEEVSLYKEFVLLLTVNDGYLDFFLNWYAHYIEHVAVENRSTMYVLAEDDVAHTKLTAFFKKRKDTEVIIEKSDLNMVSDGKYESKEYKKMVSTRATHILRHLRAGRNVLYCDVDIVWTADPFPYFPEAKDPANPVDMYIQVDTATYQGNSPYYCTGLMAIRTSSQTIALMELWEKKLEESPQLNQPIFNKVIHAKKVDSEKINHMALPMDRFPSGQAFFDKYTKQERAATVVVHNNYIIGREAKKKRFVDHDLWKPLALDK